MDDDTTRARLEPTPVPLGHRLAAVSVPSGDGTKEGAAVWKAPTAPEAPRGVPGEPTRSAAPRTRSRWDSVTRH
jgi:hypothetical protein